MGLHPNISVPAAPPFPSLSPHSPPRTPIPRTKRCGKVRRDRLAPAPQAAQEDKEKGL